MRLKDKIVLITGSTDGIGLETAKLFDKNGAQVILHGRNREKLNELIGKFSDKTDGVVCDFGSINEIKNMIENLKRKYNRIDIVINNAGVFMPVYQKTPDGYEMTWQVNYLATYIITNLLTELIVESYNGRIVNIASMAHSSSIDLEKVNEEAYFNPYRAYGDSKLADILFTFAFKDISSTRIPVVCMHPGVINTKLLKAGWGSIGSSILHGAENEFYVATLDNIKDYNGTYFFEKKPGKAHAIAYDKNLQERLILISEKQTGMNLLSRANL